MNTKMQIENLIRNFKDDLIPSDCLEACEKELFKLIKVKSFLLLQHDKLIDGSKELKWLYDTISEAQNVVSYDMELKLEGFVEAFDMEVVIKNK